jgi:hypothetical protein
VLGRHAETAADPTLANPLEQRNRKLSGKAHGTERDQLIRDRPLRGSAVERLDGGERASERRCRKRARRLCRDPPQLCVIETRDRPDPLARLDRGSQELEARDVSRA